MPDYDKELAKAVQYFWRIRAKQHKRQGSRSGQKDAGNRAAVTGGKHADGFVRLIAGIVKDAGLRNVQIHIAERKQRTLPGFYRPSKEWDLVVLSGGDLVAVVEVKSQVGSFGNNFNNRVEERSATRPTSGPLTERASSSHRRNRGLAIYSCLRHVRNQFALRSGSI
jgi:hypothetical protein